MLKRFIKSIINRRQYKKETEEKIADTYLTKLGYSNINDIRPDDYVVVGYPKSGNTWMQNLLSGILFGIDTSLLPDRLTQILTPNLHGATHFKRILDFTCFKSHHMPRGEFRNVIYIVRDGRDAISSYFHMNQADGKKISLEDMIIRGKGITSCKWHEHVKAWRENPFKSTIIWIRYEDLTKDPLKEMNRICEFMGIQRENDTILRSIEGNSFKNMQTKESQFGWDNRKWNKDAKFIRRGEVGSYRKEIPTELTQYFEEEAKEELFYPGYALNYLSK